jgi:hypothetical protein
MRVRREEGLAQAAGLLDVTHARERNDADRLAFLGERTVGEEPCMFEHEVERACGRPS